MMSAPPRILRVAVVRGGKILEERLFRRHQTVTIGSHRGATLCVPAASMPDKRPLFIKVAGRLALNLDCAQSARVSVQGTVSDLTGLAEHASMVRTRGRRLLVLDHTARGKVSVGDTTVLFQLVRQPKTLPRVPLPASARGGLSQALRAEQHLVMTIVMSLILQAGFIALSVAFETPEDKVKKKNRFVQVLTHDVQFNEPEEEVDEPETAPGDEPDPAEEEPTVADTAPVDPVPSPRVEPPSGTPKAVASARVKTPKKRHRRAPPRGASPKKTFVHVIKSNLTGLGSPDTLADGLAAKRAGAFEPAAPIHMAASSGDRNGFRGGPRHRPSTPRLARAGQTNRNIRLKPGRVGKKRPTKREDRVKLRVTGGGIRQVAGTGGKRNVGQVFRRRMGAVQRCYESRLRKLPHLKGKVVLSFTISGAGRITAIRATANTTGDAVTAQCILKRVRGWRFDTSDKGAASFKIPIVLQKG